MTQAQGYPEWPVRADIRITSPVAVANFQHKIVIPYRAPMARDFRDIRFSDTMGRPLSYWIESKTDGSTATVWINIPTASTIRIFLHYGHGAAVSESNGSNVFSFFDDFTGAAYDDAKWGVYSTGSIDGTSSISVSNSELTIAAKSTSGFQEYGLITDADQTSGKVVRCRAKHVSGAGGADWGARIGISNQYSLALRYSTTPSYNAQLLNDAVAWDGSTVAAYVLDTYAVYEERWISNNLSGRKDDGAWRTWARSTAVTNNKIRLESTAATTALCTTRYDWVAVREYAATEPVLSVQRSYPNPSRYDPILKKPPVEVTGDISAAGSITGTLSRYRSITGTLAAIGGLTGVLTGLAHRIYIDNVPVDVRLVTASIQRSVEGRGTANFTVVDTLNAKSFGWGQMVKIYLDDGATLGFAGKIQTVEEEVFASSGAKFHHIAATDMSTIADELVTDDLEFEDASPEYIAKYMVDNYLSQKGVTYTSTSIVDPVVYFRADADPLQVIMRADGDPLQTKFTATGILQCHYKSKYIGTGVLNDLRDRSGYWWNITDTGVLWFRDRAATPAPWTLTLDDVKFERRARHYRSGERYRNVQIVRNTRGLKDVYVQRHHTGDSLEYTLSYPVYTKPRVWVNGVESTSIGIRGISSGKEWYYSKDDKVLSRDESLAPLGDGDLLEVTYTGTYDQEVKVEDAVGIAARAAIEGGSGRYESVVELSEPLYEDAAREYAQGLLDTYGDTGGTRVLPFSTFRGGLMEGMNLHVTIPELGIDSDYFIESLGIEDTGASDASGQRWLYNVNAIRGPRAREWESVIGGLQ